jgi:hypothetical protein
MSKEKTIQCISCATNLERDHIGIKCFQSHEICAECSKTFVNTIFEDPESNIPVKCPLCKQEISSLTFERQLDETKLEIYQLYVVQKRIDPNEITRSCPNCHYFEIWLKTSTANFFYCKNSNCSKMTCVYCYNQIILPYTDSHSDYTELEKLMMIQDLQELAEDEEYKYEETLKSKNGIYYHFKCGELNHLKANIEKVIEKGQKMRCPECKHSGRKDSACTHMTCSNCNTIWCYFCGLNEKNADNHADNMGIYGHNIGWQYNPKRCPMYFNEINEFDESWPSDDEECLNKFHQFKTKSYLKKKIEKIGLEAYRMVSKQFNSIKNCGYDIEEIMNTDMSQPLIQRVSRDEYENMVNE